MIPMGQIVSGFTTEFEDAYVWRNDRRKMIRLHADPREGLPSELFGQVKAKIEQALNVDIAAVVGHDVDASSFDAKTLKVQDNDLWPLKDKPGYYMAWGGEAEDSARANASLARRLSENTGEKLPSSNPFSSNFHGTTINCPITT
jgi:multidrug efflux pump subunit AcrB